MTTRRAVILATLAIGAATIMLEDDLTPLFTAQPDGPAAPMLYRQGTLESWNPTTLQNTVRVGKTLFTDLPVLGVSEAASFRAGIKVGIATVDNSWAIIGRWVIPNTPDATDAITQIGQRILTATVLTQEPTNSATFVDLATVGPSVANVLVPASGKVAVTISAQITATLTNTAGSVGVEVSGATTIAPTTQQSLIIIGSGVALNGSRILLFSGLPAGGLCTFTLKYRADGVNSQDFSNRDIIVQAL